MNTKNQITIVLRQTINNNILIEPPTIQNYLKSLYNEEPNVDLS